MDWLDQLGAFLLGGGLIGLLDVFLRWKANKDLAKQKDISQAFKLIDQLQEDNETLRTRLQSFEDKNAQREREMASLRVGILILIDQLEQMNIKPRWTPEKAVMMLQATLSDKPV